MTTTEQTAMFAFTPEHDDLRAAVRTFLAARSPESEVRRLMETTTGYDPAVWTVLAEQLGLTALLVPERFGGAGFGCVELQIVCEEMGRALLCAPFLSSAVLATAALLTSGDDVACARYLPDMAGGGVIATLACDGPITAVPDGDGFLLTGEVLYVLDGTVADLVLVVAGTTAGPSMFATTGGQREPMTTLDATRKQARITFDATAATLIGVDGGAAAPLAAALDIGAAALAAEQAGGARRVLEMAVEYACVREQFGRPIGSYQAIKHKCADMLLEVESSTSAAYAAGWAIDDASAESGVLASLAKAYCSEAYHHCAAENIQIHGGIGFTWEHPAHLYFKRATSTEILLGSPRRHRELMAQRLGFGG